MVVYNFKKMAPVPNADDFIDIVLMRTQRKTPTVVHPGYKISRIRSFYMRKVKFTQETTSERLGTILTDFPRLDDIHPFYADLMNILYDRDHYKLALGGLSTCKKLVDTLSRDYVRLLKYADSLYRCKALKRAAMGRMMTLLKRQKASLAYLEEVRKHMSRLPSLDPNTRTLLVCGFPNVGKSSFMNKVTRAKVDVQPYAFTTKSLFVGHMDHRYLRWQVIDTPGILDHELDQRNTIEMQSITALAHLQCCVLFFVDISEQCGYTIDQQLSLFRSIQPLFVNKQLIIVANKIDVTPLDQIKPAHKSALETLAQEANVELMPMSNVTEEGIAAVKTKACDMLLQARVDAKVSGRKCDNMLNRLTVTVPKPRAGANPEARGPCIPPSVLAAIAARGSTMDTSDSAASGDSAEEVRAGTAAFAFGTKEAPLTAEQQAAMEAATADAFAHGGAAAGAGASLAAAAAASSGVRKTARDKMWENGGPGVWAADRTDEFLLADPSWNHDAVPHIMDGKNVADFVDPDILARLDALEAEHEQLETESAATLAAYEEPDLQPEESALLQAIRDRKTVVQQRSRVARNSQSAPMPRKSRVRDPEEIRDHLETHGIEADALIARGVSRGRSRTRRDGNDTEEDDAAMRTDDADASGKRKRSQSAASRSVSRPARDRSASGLRDKSQQEQAVKLRNKQQKKRNLMARAGEADRFEGPKLLKHRLAGKTPGMGTKRSR